MPFTSQFALSLELSRLVPLGLTGSKAAEAVMSLARDLQNSGSDIVVEEDLANLFGRSRIAPQCETSFKTAVAKTATTTTLFQGILLQSGAGPTVVRSLQHSPYFSAIVQCSLLGFCHERWSLAAVLHRIFEKQTEDAPQGTTIRSAPSQEGLSGFLEACVNQTAGYDWWRSLDAVAATLGPQNTADSAIPPAIIRGVVYMFAMVQSLPEDRLVIIHTLTGISALVVWAHHVLGLNVFVRLRSLTGRPAVEQRFGGPTDQVIIEYPDQGRVQPIPPSVTLLDGGNSSREDRAREVLFRISEDPEEELLYATNLVPVKGLARRFIRFEEDPDFKNPALERHQYLMAAAYALRLSRHLFVDFMGSTYVEEEELDSDSDSHADSSESGLPAGRKQYVIDENAFLMAVRLLCNEPNLKMQEIKEYEKGNFEGSGTRMRCTKFTQGLISAARNFDSNENVQSLWQGMEYKIGLLAVIMLASTHIHNPSESADALFSADHKVISSSNLAFLERSRKSTGELSVSTATFLDTIQVLALGSYGDIGDEYIGADVFSCHGWSIFRNIMGPPDPSLLSPFSIAIKKGTPYRNGVYRRAVVQGPVSTTRENRGWLLEQNAGDKVTLRCANQVRFKSPIIGDRRDCFVVNLRLGIEYSSMQLVRRTGYREMQMALCICDRTSACRHPTIPLQSVELPAGHRAFSDFAEQPGLNLSCRVALILTAHSAAARWRALLAIATHKERRILLHGHDCCLECTLLQAASLAAPCFVIL